MTSTFQWTIKIVKIHDLKLTRKFEGPVTSQLWQIQVFGYILWDHAWLVFLQTHLHFQVNKVLCFSNKIFKAVSVICIACLHPKCETKSFKQFNFSSHNILYFHSHSSVFFWALNINRFHIPMKWINFDFNKDCHSTGTYSSFITSCSQNFSFVPT